MLGFDHVQFWVGNAKQAGVFPGEVLTSLRLQMRSSTTGLECRNFGVCAYLSAPTSSTIAASFYVTRMGFTPVAYRGLETGSRNVCSHVVRQGKVTFVLSCSLNPTAAVELGSDMGKHLTEHGDGAKDVAFEVSDCRAVFESALKRGAKVVVEPHEEKDEFGSVVIATVATYGETVHTFVQRNGYTGAFLPGYKAIDSKDPMVTITPPIGLDFIDHVVGNMPEAGMEPSVQWYEQVLQFHRFWSVDDKQIHTEYSSLRRWGNNAVSSCGYRRRKSFTTHLNASRLVCYFITIAALWWLTTTR